VIGSPWPTGVPQRWQKRAPTETAVPQAAQKPAPAEGAEPPEGFDEVISGKKYYNTVRVYSSFFDESCRFTVVPSFLPS